MKHFLIDYTDYMRRLAAEHSSLAHTPEEKHFFRGELQEFFQQFRSDVCFPCLIAEGSENSYTGSKEQPVKHRSMSFIVADRYDQHDDYDEIQLAMSRCEQIAEEVLGRMMGDKGSPFVRVSLDSVEGVYLQNEGSRYVGYRLSFEVTEAVCLVNKNAWHEAD